MFSHELIDLAPDIFPPHLIGAFLNKDKNLFYRQGDTPESYFERVVSRKNFSTLRILQKQIYSIAKADATRRTTSVHPLSFKKADGAIFNSFDMQYFVFMEKYAETALQRIGQKYNPKIIRSMEKYQNSSGGSVLPAFFDTVSAFEEKGIMQQKDKKHKYPFHGLLYGNAAVLPSEYYLRIEQAGKIIISSLMDHLKQPNDALLFSIDFFLSPDGTIYAGRDIHEHQIGMGLQYVMNVDDSSNYYNELANLMGKRCNDMRIALDYDPNLCEVDRILAMELDALMSNMENRGFLVQNNPGQQKDQYTMRLFGGNYGYPSTDVSKLCEDRELIDSLLNRNRTKLSEFGISVPLSYKTTAQNLLLDPDRTRESTGAEVFIHPIVHHYFKPFQANLSSALSMGSAKEILCSLRQPLDKVPLLVIERAKNFITYNGLQYPHEIRAYFIPDR